MKTAIHDRENCPFCGSLNVDGCEDFIRCLECKAFGPNGRENWQKRAPSRRMKAFIRRWRDIQSEMESGGCVYTAPYDAVAELLNELEELYE